MSTRIERAIVVGLGNPGRGYKKNRHNIGFQVVDALAERHGLRFSRQQGRALVADGQISGRAVTLAKPMTYMNKSGGPVRELVSFYKLSLENLMVGFDDLDLPLGTLRIRPEGGSGGQNGMRDIIRQLGTTEYPRLRLGIGRPPGRMDPAAYVLQDFGKKEWPVVEEVYEHAADALETWLAHGIVLAMSRHNGPVSNPNDK
jgi:PTH1 family peptidyl-tRNA hydrolase